MAGVAKKMLITQAYVNKSDTSLQLNVSFWYTVQQSRQRQLWQAEIILLHHFTASSVSKQDGSVAKLPREARLLLRRIAVL